VNVGGHPIKSVSHGLWKEKRWGGVPSFIKEHKKCQSLSKTCFIFVWKIVKNPLLVVDKSNHLSKLKFYLSVLQMKSSSTCLISASLREWPFFYFYVESPPSIFMHRLREHSCHSEYNMHCPKVFIDWFMMLILLVLKLFVSSRPLKLEGVLCIYVLLSLWRISWKPFLCFSIWFEHTFDFHCFIFMIFRLCSFSCYNMVAKFLLSRLCLSCWYVHFASLFCIIIYCYSLIYFIFRVDTYVISFVFTCLMIIGGFAAGVRFLLEKGPSRDHIL
jgi:hypothetical protein